MRTTFQTRTFIRELIDCARAGQPLRGIEMFRVRTWHQFMDVQGRQTVVVIWMDGSSTTIQERVERLPWEKES